MERPIDSRLLLYVITIAEEGSITRAAKTRLFIAPGSLARDVRTLEKRIGYSLFIRKWGGVALTPAGKVFVEEAHRSLDHSQRAADRGAAASRGETGVLNVGFTPFLETSRLVEIRERFVGMMPDVTLDFRSTSCVAQGGLVLREILDAGLIILPPISDELAAKCVWRTQIVVAVPEGLSLALSEPIALLELSGIAAVWLDREVNPALYDRLRDTCQKHGCVPHIVRTALTYDEMLDAVGSGVGIGFVKESTAHRIHVEGVVFRELRDVRMDIEIGVIHRPDKSSRALQAFLRVLASLSDCDEGSSPQLGSG